MSDPGAELRINNDRIIQYLLTLKAQRNELQLLIEKQEEEKRRLQHEIERISYKLTLMAKSLAQRLAARDKYDQTIKEAEENYQRIVECSGILLNSVQKEYGVLSEAIDKRVGTEADDFKQFDGIKVNVGKQGKMITSTVAPKHAAPPENVSQVENLLTIQRLSADSSNAGNVAKKSSANEGSDDDTSSEEEDEDDEEENNKDEKKEEDNESQQQQQQQEEVVKIPRIKEEDTVSEKNNLTVMPLEPETSLTPVRKSFLQNLQTLLDTKKFSKNRISIEMPVSGRKKSTQVEHLKKLEIEEKETEKNLLEVSPDVKFFHKKDHIPFEEEEVQAQKPTKIGFSS